MSNSVRKKSSQKLRRRIGMVISYTLLGILTRSEEHTSELQSHA